MFDLHVIEYCECEEAFTTATLLRWLCLTTDALSDRLCTRLAELLKHTLLEEASLSRPRAAVCPSR